MKLYFSLRSRAVRARWLLEELGVPYELVRLDPDQVPTSPEVLALNPLGEVPVLVDGDVTLTRSPAILLHLAERGLSPPAGTPARAEFLEWLLFSETVLDPLVLAQVADGVDRTALNRTLDVLDRRLQGRTFVVGDTFSAADIALASLLHLARNLRRLDGHPALVEYLMRHVQRPASRRAVS